jgi:hypothetical protein
VADAEVLVASGAAPSRGRAGVRQDDRVTRVAACLLASFAPAACGGSDDRREPAPDRDGATRNVVTGEVRTPDARTPLIRGDGLWRCETTGRVELRVSRDGVASLSMSGRLLASVAPSRALINRACTSQRPEQLPRFRAPRALAGESRLRCAVPPRVLVDLRDGDLTVRETGGGRFLLGAAVSERHLEAAGHWSTSCAVG